MKSKVEDFLSATEEQKIIEAIKFAEQKTSGEIRVHLEKSVKNKAVQQRATEVFKILNMDETEAKNGVLIYIAVLDKQFAIIGDKGINNKVPNDFWNETKNQIEKLFKKQQFANGLVKGITMAGEQLKTYFPIQNDDTNELPNEISTF